MGLLSHTLPISSSYFPIVENMILIITRKDYLRKLIFPYTSFNDILCVFKINTYNNV